MTTDYMKNMLSIKDWNCGRARYQLKILSAHIQLLREYLRSGKKHCSSALGVSCGCFLLPSSPILWSYFWVATIFEQSKFSCNKETISHSVNLQTKCWLTLHLVFTLASTFNSWFYSALVVGAYLTNINEFLYFMSHNMKNIKCRFLSSVIVDFNTFFTEREVWKWRYTLE